MTGDWFSIVFPPWSQLDSKCIFPQFSDVFIQFLIISQACSTNLNRLQIYVYTYYIYICKSTVIIWVCLKVVCVYIYIYISYIYLLYTHKITISIGSYPLDLGPRFWKLPELVLHMSEPLSASHGTKIFCRRGPWEWYVLPWFEREITMFYHVLKGKSPCFTMFLKGNHHVLPCV